MPWSLPLRASSRLSAARPYAGSWNDGSRLATVESLVDRHTWAIDDSIFVAVPPELQAAAVRSIGTLRSTGGARAIDCGSTATSIQTNPRFPRLLMAGEYAIVQRLTGLAARAPCQMSSAVG